MSTEDEKPLYEPYQKDGGYWEFREPMTLPGIGKGIGTSGGFFTKDDALLASEKARNPAPLPEGEQHRLAVLEKIQEAQTLLSDAAQLASPLGGWADQWDDIGKLYDEVKALWHRINNAPRPGPPVTL